MNRKVIIIICAVLAFFAGAIWVSEVPVVAPLVAFLEVCAGFACGFFFNRKVTSDICLEYEKDIANYKNQILKAKDENYALQKEIKAFQQNAKSVDAEKVENKTTTQPKKKTTKK